MKITTQFEFDSLPPGHYTLSRKLVANLLNLHWRNAMHNRQLTKIVNLYHDGVSIEVCIAIIMDLTKDSTSLEKGTWIHKFYENIIAKKGSVAPKLVMISEKNDSILDGREDYKIIKKEDKE